MIDDDTHARTARDLDTEAHDLCEMLTYRYDEYMQRARAERAYLEHIPDEKEEGEIRQLFKSLPREPRTDASNAWKNAFGVVLPHRPVWPESMSVVRWIDDQDRVRYDAAAGLSSWTGSHGWTQITLTHAETRDFMRNDAAFFPRVHALAQMLCTPLMTMYFVDYADSAIAMMNPAE